VGSLIYLANSLRIDIANPASLLARFMHNPSPIHRPEADHLIVYLRDHKWLSLVVDGNVLPFGGFIQVFEGASDAAYGDDRSSRRSSEGCICRLYKCPIDWRAIRQDTVTTSTTEVELLALTHTGKQIMWWQRFFKQRPSVSWGSFLGSTEIRSMTSMKISAERSSCSTIRSVALKI
jgi:hypothetical protein